MSCGCEIKFRIYMHQAREKVFLFMHQSSVEIVFLVLPWCYHGVTTLAELTGWYWQLGLVYKSTLLRK